MDILLGGGTLSKTFCLSSLKETTLKGKNLLPKVFPFRGSLWEQILSFSWIPFSEGIGVQKSRHEIMEVVSLKVSQH